MGCSVPHAAGEKRSHQAHNVLFKAQHDIGETCELSDHIGEVYGSFCKEQVGIEREDVTKVERGDVTKVERGDVRQFHQ